MKYSILDPTGNITALVESPVEIALQPSAAEQIMRRHPEVEQVGFVRFLQDPAAAVSLRMAGGEFCGNASLCAAALYLMRCAPADAGGPAAEDESRIVYLEVSGASKPVLVRMREVPSESGRSFRGSVRMPAAEGIFETEFSFRHFAGTLPLVRMEGISHIIILRESPFFGLAEDPEAAEEAVRAWCLSQGCDGLGLMFLEDADGESRLRPLVYVPGSGTVYWENSCASGSAACGMYLAEKAGAPVRLSLREPGGVLEVESGPDCRETWLTGSVRID